MLTFSDTQISAFLAYFLWPFARIVGLMLADPLLSSRSIPRRFKAGFALLLTLLLAPILPPLPAIPVLSAPGTLLVVQQLLIGIIIGSAMRIVLTGVEMAGFLMGTQMGLGFAMFFDPQHSAQVPAVSRVLSIFATLVFLSFDGHQVLLSALADSFQSFPIGTTLPPSSLREVAIWGGKLFAWGVWLSLPVVGCLLVVNLAIGVMTRAAPQFNIFSFGFPLTLIIGFIAMYLSLPLLEPAISQLYREAFDFVATLLKAP
ncbi:flagellar biosynthetic protein FliR [Vogesella sp. LIG4]|uniref:flagellar biosynthetic protein FliR n=1 Tax=Vogesella sp. LIG4 TaxID=1192162 RepID=UPI00081FC508|nr:flagellar biosynthetic protein FliR [Vogesella sp. LIG4]SCK21023.1 flagellar biosynthetic protein FliR [Vogesella sp. LIG4]